MGGEIVSGHLVLVSRGGQRATDLGVEEETKMCSRLDRLACPMGK